MDERDEEGHISLYGSTDCESSQGTGPASSLGGVMAARKYSCMLAGVG